ncbi:MAG: hypothetical protein GY852_10610, partial [bacterium]|nr:hypothetical protein [bacterium]
DVLCKQGYDSSLSTLFLFEGVSYYLDPDSVSATLDLVGRNSNRDTVISFDYCASIPMQDVSKIYGVSELARSMASRHPNEKGRFALEEGKLESFLGDQGLKPLEHWNNQEIEAKWLTRKDGSSIGRITGWFRFVSASRTFAE